MKTRGEAVDMATTFKDQLATLAQRRKYIKNEYQSYGLDLAKELGDWKGRALYIRLAKTVDRTLLEQARYFVKDHSPNQVKTPFKLFLWKLKELRLAKQKIPQI